MKKIVYALVISLLLLSFVIFNLGKWMDVTEKPIKADIIVCLGGGDHHRFKRSLKLFIKGYATGGVMLLTGADVTEKMRRIGMKDSRVTYLQKYHPKLKYLYVPKLSSTRMEIKFIKNYMKEHAYKSALIVTDPPHSRRFTLLTSLISVEDDDTMTFQMVSSGVTWWDREHYYKNRVAREYVKWEMIKIPYNVMMYMGEK